jgi:hypothetical protein
MIKMTDQTTKKKIERIVRIKKRILKESSNLEKNYKTTFKDIKKYFNFFNKALFKEQLNPFNDIQIKKMNGCWGQCVEDYSLRKGTKFFCLEMQKKYPNKKEFLTTLAHEMIHLWQQTIKKDTGNHNSLFYSFRPKFKKYGLSL